MYLVCCIFVLDLPSRIETYSFFWKPQFRTITASRLAARTVHTSPTRLGGYSACVRSRLPTTASPRTTPLTTARGLVVEHAPADLRTRVQSSPTRHEHRVRQRGPGSQKPTDDGLVARAETSGVFGMSMMRFRRKRNVSLQITDIVNCTANDLDCWLIQHRLVQQPTCKKCGKKIKRNKWVWQNPI